MCKFTLAVNRRFNKNETDFFNIVAWEKTAEFCAKYFKKGTQIGLCGNLQNRSWEDNEGRKRYVTEVIAEEVHFADSQRGQAQTDNTLCEENQEAESVSDELPF